MVNVTATLYNQCDTKCKGNNGQMCGGATAFTVIKGMNYDIQYVRYRSDISMFHLYYDTHRDKIDFSIVNFTFLCYV